MSTLTSVCRKLWWLTKTFLSFVAPPLQATLLVVLVLFGVNATLQDILFLNRGYYVTYLFLFAVSTAVLVFQNHYERRHIVLSQWNELKKGDVPSVWKDLSRLPRDRYFVSYFLVTLVLSLALAPFYIPLEASALGWQDSPVPAWTLSPSALLHQGFPTERLEQASSLPSLTEHVLLIVLPKVFIVSAIFLLKRRYSYRTLRDNEPALLEQEKSTSLPARILSALVWICLPILAFFAIIVITQVLVTVFVILYQYAAGTLALILAILVIFWLARFFRRLRIRKRFLREFRRVCKENGLTPAWLVHPLWSILRPMRKGVSMILATPKCVYAVKIVAANKPRLPMLIEPEGDVVIQRETVISPRIVRGGKYLTQVNGASMLNWGLRYSLGFDTEALEAQYSYPNTAEPLPVHRILLLNPAPKQVRFGYDYDYRLVDNSDKVGNMALWTASGFCRHVELSLRGDTDKPQ